MLENQQCYGIGVSRMRLNHAMPAFQHERACKQLKFVTIVNTLNQRQSRVDFGRRRHLLD